MLALGALVTAVLLVATNAFAGGSEKRAADGQPQPVAVEGDRIVKLCDSIWNGASAKGEELECSAESMSVVEEFCDSVATDDYQTEGCSCGDGWYCNANYVEFKYACGPFGAFCCTDQRIKCATGCVGQPCGVNDYCI